jgi:hypothetical protein
MTIFDYVVNAFLVGLVVLQMRGRRLDRRGLLLPLGLVAWAGSHYLHAIPTAGNDGLLVGLGVFAGVGLGVASARLTRLDVGFDGVPVARATLAAATLWVVGIGSRMGFALFTEHGGAATVARFSRANHLTGAGWVSGMVLMAFAEVISRTVVLWVRSRSLVVVPPQLALG